jgi:hypothetical protein
VCTNLYVFRYSMATFGTTKNGRWSTGHWYSLQE